MLIVAIIKNPLATPHMLLLFDAFLHILLFFDNEKKHEWISAIRNRLIERRWPFAATWCVAVEFRERDVGFSRSWVAKSITWRWCKCTPSTAWGSIAFSPSDSRRKSWSSPTIRSTNNGDASIDSWKRIRALDALHCFVAIQKKEEENYAPFFDVLFTRIVSPWSDRSKIMYLYEQ